jgi:hypothetical protein
MPRGHLHRSLFTVPAFLLLIGYELVNFSLLSAISPCRPTDGAPLNLFRTPVNTYSLAYKESLGFFDDISDEEWEQLKKKIQEMQPNTNGDPNASDLDTGAFFQQHYEPDFTCRHERRIGQLGDGGKWVCDPHRLAARNRSCLVYSVGSSGETSFEAAIRREIGAHCEVHTFDIKNYTEQVDATGAIFHQWGIAEANYREGVYVYRTLQQTIEELGHVGRTIDIFKIDCDGCEWRTFSSWLDANVTLRQVLIELHEAKQKIVKQPETMDFFKRMAKDYVIFHKEPNIQFWNDLRCVEYAFLKLSQAVFGNRVG